MENIILIGYMGCGKTTTSIKLSYRMKQPLIDTDKEIEKNEKCTISQIFEEKGEDAFRDMETEYIRKLLQKKGKYIIATGGGLPIRLENRTLLKKLGKVVYLRAKPETVYERIKGDTTRPLLQCENPLEKIKQMQEDRKDAYESCADLVLDTDDVDIADLVETIVNHVW